MDLAFKLARIRRLSRSLGFLGAAWLEARWSVRLPRVKVWIPELRRRVIVRRHDSDIDVLEEVLVGRECDVPLPARPRLIIDAGANVGYMSAWFGSRYPEATVVAIEPDAENCRLVRENCAGLPNVRLIEGALCAWSGWARIVNPEAASWAFQVGPCEESAPGAIPAFTLLDALVAAELTPRPIDLFKCDIEGGETALFSADASEWLPLVGVIAIELHSEAARTAVLAATARAFQTSSMRGEKMILTAKPSAARSETARVTA